MTRWVYALALAVAAPTLGACGQRPGAARSTVGGAARAGAAAPLPGGAALSGVRKEIVATTVRLVRAEVQGDVDSLMVLWSADPEAITNGGRVYQGRTAVRAMFRSYLAANKVTAITMDMKDLWVTGDTAFTVGLIAGTVSHGGSAAVPVRGAYMAVRVRDARGAWLLHRWMFDTHRAAARR